MTAAADRHLLFGLLALQNGLIDQGQLVAAFQAWSRDKSKSLAENLEARGDLDAGDRSAVEALVARHIKRHDGDLEKSLAAVPSNRSTRAGLTELGEPEIEATLARVARSKNGQATEADADHDDDPERTAALSLGAATSDGERFRILRPHARGGLGPSSWRSTASCTARSRSSRSSKSTPTTRPAASGSSPRRRSPEGSNTRVSCRSTVWVPTTADDRITR